MESDEGIDTEQFLRKELSIAYQEIKKLKRQLKNLQSSMIFKRPAKLVGLEKEPHKRVKTSPPSVKAVDDSPAKSEPEVRDTEDNIRIQIKSEERREKTRNMIREFNRIVRPTYSAHLEEERKRQPKLRTRDGKLIRRNIKYIR